MTDRMPEPGDRVRRAGFLVFHVRCTAAIWHVDDWRGHPHGSPSDPRPAYGIACFAAWAGMGAVEGSHG
jgi:hypothetical protein